MNRRQALATFLALGVSACAGKTPDQIGSDFDLELAGLSAVVAALGGISGISATVMQDAPRLLNDLRSQRAAIVDVLNPGVDTVTKFSQGAIALATLVQPYLPQASQYLPLVLAVISLANSSLQAVGRAPAAASMQALAMMSPAEARLVLKGVR